MLEALFSNWQEPVMERIDYDGTVKEERGVPLRAMLAYLFGETAKNLYSLKHPERYIEYISRSQLGDRSFDIDYQQLPSRQQMEGSLPWEKKLSGSMLMKEWLLRFEATPFNYNEGLDDASLDAKIGAIEEAIESGRPDPEYTQLRLMEGGSFFRGLALIDLAEAMLKRAFGEDAVAVRLNAAGMGGFFQIHIDTTKVAVEEVKSFMEKAFYRRFGLEPENKFAEVYPGGPAIGMHFDSFNQASDFVEALRLFPAANEEAASTGAEIEQDLQDAGLVCDLRKAQRAIIFDCTFPEGIDELSLLVKHAPEGAPLAAIIKEGEGFRYMVAGGAKSAKTYKTFKEAAEAARDAIITQVQIAAVTQRHTGFAKKLQVYLCTFDTPAGLKIRNEMQDLEGIHPRFLSNSDLNRINERLKEILESTGTRATPGKVDALDRALDSIAEVLGRV